MTSIDNQLEQWVKGNSIHNEERDECCPDFSCCNPALLASEDERRTFAEANDDVRWMMLIGYLTALLAYDNKGEKVYIAGDPANYELEQ